MNRNILLLLLGLMSISLLCGCPRTDESTGNAGDTNTPPPVAEAQNAAENPCTADDNPCADNPCAADENPCGENPCGDNPCTMDENPCNPCSETDNPCAAEEPEDTVTTIVLETTDGDIVLEVHSAWSPLGAAHFIELVEAGFYDGAPWFRVIDGFVAQCGVSADPAMNSKWSNATIKDEPVVVGNKRGFVAFGKSGMPNSRSTHIFINYTDNSASLNPQGFSCFAQVVEGMDVAQGLFKCEFGDQGALGREGGVDAFKVRYPDADFIKRAYIRE